MAKPMVRISERAPVNVGWSTLVDLTFEVSNGMFSGTRTFEDCEWPVFRGLGAAIMALEEDRRSQAELARGLQIRWSRSDSVGHWDLEVSLSDEKGELRCVISTYEDELKRFGEELKRFEQSKDRPQSFVFEFPGA